MESMDVRWKFLNHFSLQGIEVEIHW